MKCPLLALLVATALAAPNPESLLCQPQVNCKFPQCRCAYDTKLPGSMDPLDAPQMIVLSFGYSVNEANVKTYMDLLTDLSNPNHCNTKATFFVEGLDSDFFVVKDLYLKGHEIGMLSDDGEIPKNSQQWTKNFQDLLEKLHNVGIPFKNIKGVRAPKLFYGGDNELWAMRQVGLSYDSSCVSRSTSQADKLIWPYTLDFAVTAPQCTIGEPATYEHAGIWEFAMPEYIFRGIVCSSLSGCSPGIEDSNSAYELLINAFVKHYISSRAPFTLYLDPEWLSKPHQVEGTKRFLQFVRSNFLDTWIVSHSQALQWMQDPVPWKNATSFGAWGCKTSEKIRNIEKSSHTASEFNVNKDGTLRFGITKK